MKEYFIDENDAHQRLDKFLKKLFPSATRSLLFKLNRKDKIKVLSPHPNPLPKGEGEAQIVYKKTKQDNEYKLQVGEKVQIFLSEKEIGELSEESLHQPLSGRGEQEKLSKKDIVYEDGNLLIINKNPGLNVHPGDHKSQEISLIQQVEDYYAGKLNSLTFKPSLIHRIDRDTSGIILIAKDKNTLTKLSSEFKKKSTFISKNAQNKPHPTPLLQGEGTSSTGITKVYFALVIGKLSRESGTIKKNLLRIEDAKNENKVQVNDAGQEAITHYTVLEEYRVQLPEGEHIISALEVTIETGRMHQIRVHMAHIGNPILGDKTYGDKRLNAYFAKNFGVTRQMLHAWKIEFLHPKSEKKMSLTARLKEDMENFMSKIK